ncbi:MAG: hypothetical protein AB1816_14780 [Bacillota bacterium]
MAVALPEGVAMADPPTVLVYLRIVEDVGEREYPELPVTVRNLPEGMTGSCQPARVKVVARGRKDILQVAALEPWVDGAGEPGERQVAVQVEAPPGVEILSVEPTRVTLTTGRQ